MLTLEDPARFADSRRVDAYLGLTPGSRHSGDSDPQMHISKEGDPFLRQLLVHAAHYVLGPFGPDCDLRRHGLKLAARGGKAAKKRAAVAVARKLAVVLHRPESWGNPWGHSKLPVDRLCQRAVWIVPEIAERLAVELDGALRTGGVLARVIWI